VSPTDFNRRIKELTEAARFSAPDDQPAIWAELAALRHAQATGQTELDFDGPTYESSHDCARLTGQTRRVHQAMLAASYLGQWLTLSEIRERTGDPEASISARLRDLRKDRFGGLEIEKRRRGEASRGLWEYRLAGPLQAS